MRHFAYAAWAATLCVSIAGAQPQARKEPAQYVAVERASRVEARPPGIRLGLRKPRELALAPLSGPELARLARPEPRLRIGIHRPLPANPMLTGQWEVEGDGSRVWRMAIHSPGAAGIRLEFRNFSVGGGRVWLHDGSRSAGPYSGRGLFDDGHFWTATVNSDSIIVEYEPAGDSPAEIDPPFEIRSISHQAAPAARARARAEVRAADTPEAATKDTAAYCHLDPNCYAEWKPAMSMVGQIKYESDGDTYLCSGALVATRDNSFKPYFLTAGHCIHSEEAARSVEAYWTYQTSSCGAAGPASRESSTKSSVGANLIGWAPMSRGDYSLILLKDVPSGVTFSGWDPSDPPLGGLLTGIHHPMGSWKRISFGERVADMPVEVEGEGIAPADKFLESYWDKGRTEPGSSGSPLFTSPGVIVGTLSYGEFSPDISVCEIEPSISGYGRFSNVYADLSDYFENLPAALITPDKAQLAFNVVNRAAPQVQTVRLTTKSAGQMTYKLRADVPWIKLSSMTGTVSAATPAPITISIDPSGFDQDEQYSSTVAILTGAATPQYINVTVTAKTVALSDITASITPAMVVPSNGIWSFTIRLADNGGAATRVTALKMNGADYSSSIAAWFGTDHIDANGAIEAPLSGRGRFPSGQQYFEFWGVDDATGHHWYRVAMVTFQ